MSKEIKRALCVVVSAPSGAGKTTLCERLLAEFTGMAYSVSCTTRPARPGEMDGRSYVFMDEPEFKRRIEAGEFLEHAEVHGCWYGTSRRDVEDALAAGRDVLMDIDVQGAASIRSLALAAPGSALGRAYVDIFIMPPDIGTLEQRLRGRGKDSDDVIRKRLRNAVREMERQGEYRYSIMNDSLDKAYARLRAIIIAEHGGRGMIDV